MARETEVPTQLATRLRLAVMRLARRLRQQARAGVSASMLSALASIERLGPLTLGELAEVERIQPPTITRIVGRLEEEGLVARQADPDDGRVMHVSLTGEGRRFIGRARTAKDVYIERHLNRLSAEEHELLTSAVDALERLLEEET